MRNAKFAVFFSFLGYKLEKDVVIHMKAHPKKSPTCENMEKKLADLIGTNLESYSCSKQLQCKELNLGPKN